MYLRTNYAIRTSKLEETLGSPQQKIQQHRQQQSDIKDLLIEKVRLELNIAKKKNLKQKQLVAFKISSPRNTTTYCDIVVLPQKRNDDDGHQFTFVIRNQNVFCFRFSF